MPRPRGGVDAARAPAQTREGPRNQPGLQRYDPRHERQPGPRQGRFDRHHRRGRLHRRHPGPLLPRAGLHAHPGRGQEAAPRMVPARPGRRDPLPGRERRSTTAIASAKARWRSTTSPPTWAAWASSSASASSACAASSINTHMIEAAYRAGAQRYFFSSSACAYNTHLQQDPNVRALKESDAYPAMAERGYGWEKLISEMFCEEYWAERGMKTAHRPLPQRLRPQRHLGWRAREGAGGDLPQGHRGQRQRQPAHRDLGRRQRRPAASVHRRLREGHRPDHALRRAHRHADQPRLERTGLDQRAGVARSRRSPA